MTAPPHPDYPAALSTLCAGGAEILKDAFGPDIAFTRASGSAPEDMPDTLNYDTLDAAVESCTMSRILQRTSCSLVRDRLMQPEAVKEFISAYHAEINTARDAAAAARSEQQQALAERQAKLEAYYDAVADGLRTPGLLGKLEGLEAEVDRLKAALAAPAPSATHWLSRRTVTRRSSRCAT